EIIIPERPWTGTSNDGIGLFGESVNSVGIKGHSFSKDGVQGWSDGFYYSGVFGENRGGGIGVTGRSENGWGVFASSETHEALHASTNSEDHVAIAALSMNRSSQVPALFVGAANGKAAQFNGAAVFRGTIEVNGFSFIRSAIDVLDRASFL